MLITILGSMMALIICIAGCWIMTIKMKQLSAQIKALEKKADTVETIYERDMRNFTGDLIKFYREEINKQTKRVEEAIKIFEERRSALEDQMNCARVLSDTMVDAFKHRLSEAEQERQMKSGK